MGTPIDSEWQTSAGQLNIPTKEFEENRRAGLLICGINWGGGPDAPPVERPRSFFSDTWASPFSYTEALVEWFGLWGHPLQTTEALAGPFERSLVQTNWLPTETPNADGITTEDLVSAWGNFEWHVRALQPSFLLLLSVTQLDALNDARCQERATALLGRVLTQEQVNLPAYDGRPVPNLRAIVQQRAGIQVVALPHPSRRVWAKHGDYKQYMRSLSGVMSPLLERYKRDRGFTA